MTGVCHVILSLVPPLVRLVFPLSLPSSSSSSSSWVKLGGGEGDDVVCGVCTLGVRTPYASFYFSLPRWAALLDRLHDVVTDELTRCRRRRDRDPDPSCDFSLPQRESGCRQTRTRRQGAGLGVDDLRDAVDDEDDEDDDDEDEEDVCTSTSSMPKQTGVNGTSDSGTRVNTLSGQSDVATDSDEHNDGKLISTTSRIRTYDGPEIPWSRTMCQMGTCIPFTSRSSRSLLPHDVRH